eukprot:2195401-Rhodomonas_salina.3
MGLCYAVVTEVYGLAGTGVARISLWACYAMCGTTGVRYRHSVSASCTDMVLHPMVLLRDVRYQPCVSGYGLAMRCPVLRYGRRTRTGPPRTSSPSKGRCSRYSYAPTPSLCRVRYCDAVLGTAMPVHELFWAVAALGGSGKISKGPTRCPALSRTELGYGPTH